MNRLRPFLKPMGYTLAFILLLALGAIIYREKEDYPDYTSYSTGENGVKALFLLTEEMGYDAGRFERSAGSLPSGATMVAVNPVLEYFNREPERKKLGEWLKGGNTLVLIAPSSMLESFRLGELSTGAPELYNLGGLAAVSKAGEGFIVYLDSLEKYTNHGLKEIDPGVLFIKCLDNSGNRKVLFNEYYHGIQKGGLSIWNLLGPSGTLVLLQVLLAAAVLMYIASRRLGKPAVVFETVKRPENENLAALAGIYMKAGANTNVLETYLASFKKELSRFLGFSSEPDRAELLRAAEGSRFLDGFGIRDILDECDRYLQTGKHKTRRMIHLVERIEEIRKGIRQ